MPCYTTETFEVVENELSNEVLDQMRLSGALKEFGNDLTLEKVNVRQSKANITGRNQKALDERKTRFKQAYQRASVMVAAKKTGYKVKFNGDKATLYR